MLSLPNTHHLKLQQCYFDLVKQQKKHKEGRTNTGTASIVAVGDYIEFNPNDADEICKVQVTQVSKYASFKDMLLQEGVENFLPNSNLSLDEAISLYQSFPSYKDREEQHGVLSISFTIC